MINGINISYVEYDYIDSDCGKMDCFTFAIETRKGVRLVTFDVIEKGKDLYMDDFEMIRESIQN